MDCRAPIVIASMMAACSSALHLADTVTTPIDWENLKGNILFVGVGRSGSSLVGTLLDAHPRIIVSNEANILQKVARHAHRYSNASFIYEKLYNMSRQQADEGRSGGHNYEYGVKGQWQGKVKDFQPYYVGDKKAAATAGLDYPEFVSKLQTFVHTTKLPLKVIHVHRNPFDNIATLSLIKAFESQDHHELHDFEEEVDAGRAAPLAVGKAESFAKAVHNGEAKPMSIDDWQMDWAINWYFTKMKIVDTLVKTLDIDPLAFGYPVEVISVDYHAFIHEPVKQLSDICARLSLDCSDEYLQACAGTVWEHSHHSMLSVKWGQDRICEIMRRTLEIDDLKKYMVNGTIGEHATEPRCNGQCFPGDWPCACQHAVNEPKDICVASKP